MNPLGIEPFPARHFEKRHQDIAAFFRSTGRPGHTKPVTAARNFDIEAALDLSQVFIELTAQVGEAVVVGGLEDDVPRNLDSVQSEARLPRCRDVGKPVMLPRLDRRARAGNSAALR